MTAEPSSAPLASSPDRTWRRHLAPVAAAGIVVLALAETVSALVAPLRAPTTSDWRAVAATVRAGFRPGDLIVAAPAWSDQVMRLHLGDLIPLAVIGRMDDARFGRVWEISQRGGRAPGTKGARMVEEKEHGPLDVRLYERPAAIVTYDFVGQWSQAQMTRAVGASAPAPCPLSGDRLSCGGGFDVGFSYAMPSPLEMDFTIRQVLFVPGSFNVGSPAVSAHIEYPNVALGRELAVGTGLHNAWWRELPGADGVVTVRVLVGGNEVGRAVCNNRSGWQVQRFDTSSWAGKTAAVRFELRSDKMYGRLFGLAAEARNPAGKP